ncbi:MAG TPA: IS4 family transposase, partial [Gammaproteobacteria bacterium]|nr:IS4 family transposase [Gammaproteobacteria bacterium]
CELSRVLAREDCLWAPRLKVSQQALSQRFLSFPAELFQRVLWALLPRLRQRWAERQRPPCRQRWCTRASTFRSC